MKKRPNKAELKERKKYLLDALAALGGRCSRDQLAREMVRLGWKESLSDKSFHMYLYLNAKKGSIKLIMSPELLAKNK